MPLSKQLKNFLEMKMTASPHLEVISSHSIRRSRGMRRLRAAMTCATRCMSEGEITRPRSLRVPIKVLGEQAPKGQHLRDGRNLKELLKYQTHPQRGRENHLNDRHPCAS